MTPNKFYNNILSSKLAIGNLNSEEAPTGNFYQLDYLTREYSINSFKESDVIKFIFDNISYLNSKYYYFYGTRLNGKVYLSIYGKSNNKPQAHQMARKKTSSVVLSL